MNTIQQAILDSAGYTIISTDRDGTIRVFNKAAERILGYSAEEVVGKHTPELFHSRSEIEAMAAQLTSELNRTIEPGFEVFVAKARTGVPDENEWTYLTKNGTVVPVLLSVTALFDSDGNITGFLGMGKDISERKEKERLLRESHEGFLAMLDGLDAMVYVADMETYEVLFINDYGKKAFGEITGKICWRTLQKDQTGPCKFCSNNRLFSVTGEPTGVNIWEFRNTVSERWYEIRDRAIRWIDGRLVRLEIAVDITVRKSFEAELLSAHAELELRVQERTAELKQVNKQLEKDAIDLMRTHEEMRESESRYRAIVENTGAATVIIEENRIISFANTEYEKLSGYSKNEIEGKKSWTDFIPKDELQRMTTYHAVRRKDPDAAPRNYEFRFVDRKGGEKNIFLTVAMIPGTTKSVASLLDITERKLAELLLQDQFHFLQVLIDTIPNPVYYKDFDGRYLGCNAAFEKCIGFGRDQIIGKTTYVLAPEEIADSHHEMDDKLFREPGIQTYEGLATFADGTTHTMIFNKATFMKKDGAVGGIVGIMIDITERRKLEEQLLQAQKMEAIGLLAGGVAHDFNNLLTAIIGQSSMLLRKRDTSAAFKTEIGLIQEAADRAAVLTRQLLAFSRRQILEMRAINPNEVIDNLAKFLRRIIGEDIALEFHTGKTVRNVMADKGQIEQVIMNLAVNARDAMPKGGKLIIETAEIEVSERFRPDLRPGLYVLVKVSDTGSGIDKEVQEKIFEPFFTTKHFGKGTGLGLSMAYGIIKQHEGDIDVYSDLGKGTTFEIYLPAIENPTEPKEESSPVLLGGRKQFSLWKMKRS